MMTIYIPMPVWHAFAFIRDPGFVFGRMKDPKHNSRKAAPGELLFGKRLVGFHTRSGAIRTWRATTMDEFAVVAIEYGDVLHEKMARERKINGTAKHRDSGEPVWTVTADGCADLLSAARFCMEVIKQEKPQAPPAPDLGAGPTGFGGC
jgi:hypothetical protein